MIELFLIWIITVVTFFIGFYIGKGKADPESLQDLAQTIIKKVRKQNLGAVNKTPFEVIAKRGTRLEQTEKAMEELLDQKIGK